MMKVCGLTERNIGSDDRYRYLTGVVDSSTKLVIMPNRNREEDPDADWIAYIAAAKEEEPTDEAEAPSQPD